MREGEFIEQVHYNKKNYTSYFAVIIINRIDYIYFIYTLSPLHKLFFDIGIIRLFMN